LYVVRFASIGSGSRGNGTLVEHGNTCLLVDCGFTLKETERRLARLQRDAAALSAILITHEHADHARGVGALARKYDIPVWMTPGTRAAMRLGDGIEPRAARHGRRGCGLDDLPAVRFFNSHEPFEIAELLIRPFPVPHDAREPSQFVFDTGQRRLGLLTDTGCITPHIESMLIACDALLLECNHDAALLANGHYSWPLKQRVGGGLGHLSNAQAAQLLGRITHEKLQHVVAMHLSENNNTPALARAALSAALNCSADWVTLAHQDHGLAWRELL